MSLTNGELSLTLGQNFPVSDYYRDHILDGITVARGGGWWTAVLLISDPKTGKPFVGLYRWQFDGTTWKNRKSISFKSKKQLNSVVEAVGKMVSRVGEGPETRA